MAGVSRTRRVVPLGLAVLGCTAPKQPEPDDAPLVIQAVPARRDALELRSLTDGELDLELSLTDPQAPARELVALGLGWSAAGMPFAVSKRGPATHTTRAGRSHSCR